MLREVWTEYVQAQGETFLRRWNLSRSSKDDRFSPDGQRRSYFGQGILNSLDFFLYDAIEDFKTAEKQKFELVQWLFTLQSPHKKNLEVQLFYLLSSQLYNIEF